MTLLMTITLGLQLPVTECKMRFGFRMCW